MVSEVMQEAQEPLIVALDLSGYSCLVVGGGSVGRRRALQLSLAGADVVVVDPSPAPELLDLEQSDPKVRVIAGRFAPEHVRGHALVVSATGVPEVDAVAAAAARAEGALTSRPGGGGRGAVRPILTRRVGFITVGVSLDPPSPVAARLVADRVIGRLDSDTVDVAEEVAVERSAGGPGGALARLVIDSRHRAAVEETRRRRRRRFEQWASVAGVSPPMGTDTADAADPTQRASVEHFVTGLAQVVNAWSALDPKGCPTTTGISDRASRLSAALSTGDLEVLPPPYDRSSRDIVLDLLRSFRPTSDVVSTGGFAATDLVLVDGVPTAIDPFRPGLGPAELDVACAVRILAELHSGEAVGLFVSLLERPAPDPVSLDWCAAVLTIESAQSFGSP